MIEESTRGLKVQRITFLSGKQLLLLWRGKLLIIGFQRQDNAEFEPFDFRVINHSLHFILKLLKGEKTKLPNGVKLEELKGGVLDPIHGGAPRIDSRKAYYKGELCWIKPKVLCQEGFCYHCAIYIEAKLCLYCWEERDHRVKLEHASSRNLPNRFFCPECREEYFFEE